MSDDLHTSLMNEIRYAERLCARTARLYRRVQAVGVFFTVAGGSAAFSALWGKVPPEIAYVGAGAFAVFGAALIAIRPADKAAANEADVKRYAKLRSDGRNMDVEALRVALDKARESDTPEVEPLRDVAYNDVTREIGREDSTVRLRLSSRVLAVLA